jgi:hypothetical protein
MRAHDLSTFAGVVVFFVLTFVMFCARVAWIASATLMSRFDSAHGMPILIGGLIVDALVTACIVGVGRRDPASPPDEYRAFRITCVVGVTLAALICGFIVAHSPPA